MNFRQFKLELSLFSSLGSYGENIQIFGFIQEKEQKNSFRKEEKEGCCLAPEHCFGAEVSRSNDTEKIENINETNSAYQIFFETSEKNETRIASSSKKTRNGAEVDGEGGSSD